MDLKLGYKFMTGDIAVRLERTDVQVTNRKTGKKENKIVGFGFNGFNTHHLQHFIQEGAYKLVLYLPVSQNRTVAPCTPFTMMLTTSWRTKEEDIFSCPHPKLPSDFDSLTLADRPNLVHVLDRYLIENWSNSFVFTTTVPVTLRIDATSEIPFQFELQQYTGNAWTSVGLDIAGELFVPELAGGKKYQVVFFYEYLDELFFCPSLDLEFVMRPKSEVKDSLAAFSCPSGHVNTLPALPTNFRYGSTPFKFDGLDISGKEQVFYAFPEFGSVVGQWTLEVSQDAFFDLSIGSYFLSSNIRAELTSSNGRVKLRSDSLSFNDNRLVAELQPDVYTLKLTQAEPTGAPLVTCSPYTFTLVVESLASWKQANYCEDITVLGLPPSLDLLRYLGFDRSLNVQNDKFLVPNAVSDKILVEHITTFQIKERSLFRIYVEEHKIDIDVELHRTLPNGTITEHSAPVASGVNGFGEESFVVILDPGFYAIQFLFWNWESEKSHCLPFDMEVAISPMTHLPVRPAKCLEARRHEFLWPSIPSKLDKTVLPYFKEYSGYFQQKDDVGARKSYNISIDFDFDIHLELGYNFIVSDLVLEFAGADKSFVEYGSNEYTRNVFIKKNVPAGDYVISIYEAVPNVAGVLGCSDFDFFLFVDEADQEVEEVQRKDSGWLPDNLNTLPYLLYSNELKLHEQNFLIFSASLSAYAKAITFNVRVPSLIHVVIDGDSSSAAPFLVNLVQGQPKSDDLLQVIPAGSHTLYFYTNDKSSHAVGVSLTMANIHLSIQPFEQMKSETQALCAPSQKAWVPEPIVVRATDGYYHYREERARVDSNQVTITGPIHTIPFDVDRDSVVSVQVYYEFLWGDLHLSLSDKANTRVHHGYNDYNSNDLQALIPAGSYVLTISQPLGWPAGINYRLPCSEFFIRISISAASSTADRVDCSAFEIFPWDLMSSKGGSADFGGPMTDGQVRLWSDKFLMNGDGSELASTFSLAQPSVITLFVSQPTWNDLSSKIVKKGGDHTSLVTYSERHTWYQQVSVFKPTDTASTAYELKLSYLPSSWTSCAQFSMGLAIAPVSVVEQSLISACAKNPVLPPTTLTKSIYQLSSRFSDKDIAAHTQPGKGFSYAMEFSITDTTELDVALTYDPLQSFFILRLYANRGGPEDPWNLFTEGTWKAVTQGLFTQVVDVRLDKRFTKYRLAIEQDKPILSPNFASQTFCYPFNFVFQLGTGDQPFVRYVEPTTGDKLNPERDFYLELRFSSPLYFTETGTAPRKADRTKATTDLLVNYLYLQDLKSTDKKINPVEARAPQDNPQPDDGTRWIFIFSSKNLEYGVHYQLKLNPQHLFDESGKEVVLRTVHNYTMAEYESRCNGHGTYNEKTKQCVCNGVEHRTGPTCRDCEPGYYEKDGKCVRPTGCADRTCGCGPASTASHCVPLGVCNPSTDPAHPEAVSCSCNSPKYAGNFCEKCAVGYSNYPMCTKDSCDPPCEHGDCREDGTCACKPHWDGPQCNQCAPGFSGSNCETEHGIMKVVGMISLVLIICAVVALAVWYFKFRRAPGAGADFGLVTNDDILLEGMGQTKQEELELGSDSDHSSELEGSSDSWQPEKKVNEGTADADSIEISSSDSDGPAPGGNLL